VRLDYLLLGSSYLVLALVGWFEPPVHRTYLFGLLGAAIGAVIGVLTSPYDTERGEFSEYAKVIAGFFTGFVISKFDRVFELLLQEDRRSVLLTTSVLTLVCYFAASLAVTLLLVFAYRRYEGEEEAATPKGPR
jgi:drug/metabolite transporter (DMT)-like permease